MRGSGLAPARTPRFMDFGLRGIGAEQEVQVHQPMTSTPHVLITTIATQPRS